MESPGQMYLSLKIACTHRMACEGWASEHRAYSWFLFSRNTFRWRLRLPTDISLSAPLEALMLLWLLELLPSWNQTVNFLTYEEDAPGTIIVLWPLTTCFNPRAEVPNQFRLLKQFSSFLIRGAWGWWAADSGGTLAWTKSGCMTRPRGACWPSMCSSSPRRSSSCCKIGDAWAGAVAQALRVLV